MGYSKEYIQNMTALHQTLRINPKTDIYLVSGPDQLCEKYPADSHDYHCENNSIYKRDDSILKKLGIQSGQVLKWEEIEARIRKYVVPDDINSICATCSWRSYGICQEGGVQEMLDRTGLRKLE
ncbi:iron-sulfur binding protein [Gracilibacillus boraciitolerans JCM 21714]|uniref:Iron-sulfur binding protein n=1 Tax=Gracilibacillus boraciitolerans JCM 21714 TaxID=1298598 RepID=W4VJ00_9BACI|nr:iron-sulfur binding protein [Gracilibacillus boraciitolerans JCM 21714]